MDVRPGFGQGFQLTNTKTKLQQVLAHSTIVRRESNLSQMDIDTAALKMDQPVPHLYPLSFSKGRVITEVFTP